MIDAVEFSTHPCQRECPPKQAGHFDECQPVMLVIPSEKGDLSVLVYDVGAENLPIPSDHLLAARCPHYPVCEEVGCWTVRRLGTWRGRSSRIHGVPFSLVAGRVMTFR